MMIIEKGKQQISIIFDCERQEGQNARISET